jgi:hypothetical protein
MNGEISVYHLNLQALLQQNGSDPAASDYRRSEENRNIWRWKISCGAPMWLGIPRKQTCNFAEAQWSR